MPETTYVVLRHEDFGDGSTERAKWAWTVENSNVPAASAEAAIRLTCKNGNAPAGTYVAVPQRSWRPVTVKAETTVVLKLDAADAPERGAAT